ncbi:Barwin [Kalmanozyma brasiliensis GHG001]|uniref:Barwin domain-containing protein n=1 Tax=Kalmanozyma brasiliensis (strain GHG001) TaxID=1365824 RepID=V5GJQ7_KALBG|nr:Barwin [Kalmanozyma brasiliensis GHG001]EST06192.1 Barwin [Kalmanozyma brasiliensis GHG001]
MIASNVLAIALAVAGASAAPLTKRGSGGQATYYAAGLGACGWTNSGSDFIVAMNAPEWAGGSHCGQTVTITNNQNGNTQTAQVADLCPGCSWGSLDMSTGLFSALNNGNMDAGVFPISWTFGSGSSAQQSNQQQQKQQQEQPTSTYTPAATYTKTFEPSYTPTPSSVSWSAAAAPTVTTSYAPQPSSASTNAKTVVSTPDWWANVNNACGFVQDAASLPIAISASALLPADKLMSACGKWVQVKNNQNGKELSVQVVNFYEGDGQIALGEAYKRLANNYAAPEAIESITWGFIDGQGM